jgi:DNA-binding winged helix-turn-helix (wHTH) protein
MVGKTYSFGAFELQPERGALLKGGKPVRLGSRAPEILIALVDRAGEVVSNRELLARVWPETFVLTAVRRVNSIGPISGRRFELAPVAEGDYNRNDADIIV